MVTIDKCEGLPRGGDSLRILWVVPLGGAGENPFKLLGVGFYHYIPRVGANRISAGLCVLVGLKLNFRSTPIRNRYS